MHSDDSTKLSPDETACRAKYTDDTDVYDCLTSKTENTLGYDGFWASYNQSEWEILDDETLDPVMDNIIV